MRNRLILCLAWAAVIPARAAEDPRLTQEARAHLKALIALDTSNPPGNEIVAAEYLKSRLDEQNIPAEIYTSSPTRSSLIARLKAPKGAPRKRPLVLMCHTDVVPADATAWSTDPFVATEKDGYLYGRGAADIKCMCAAELAVMFALKRSSAALNRDVIFFAEADEESGGRDRHIGWLLKNHADLLDARYAVNEGGNTIWENGRVVELRVQAAEKDYLDFTLVARGAAGHSSVPRGDNPIAALARAVTRVSTHRFAARMEEVVRTFLARQQEIADPQLRLAIRDALAAVAGPELDSAADRLAALNPDFGAMLRDTVSPTILEAGYKSNVIPGSASATFNARLLPGRAPEEFIAEVGAAVDDPSVEILYDPPVRRSARAMPTDTEFYRAVEASAKELTPGVRVMPFMAAWSTDSQELRERGVVVYGVDPPLSVEDGERVHGNDERISLEALDWYARFLYKVARQVAVQ